MKIPVLIILVIGIFPDEQNIAFGGVDTGRTNPKDDASAIATATGIGLIPAVIAVVIARGPIMFVAAV